MLLKLYSIMLPRTCPSEGWTNPSGAHLLTWISHYINYTVRDEITNPFPNLNGYSVEVWEWIINFIPHFTGYMITNAVRSSPTRTDYTASTSPCFPNWTLSIICVCHFNVQRWHLAVNIFSSSLKSIQQDKSKLPKFLLWVITYDWLVDLGIHLALWSPMPYCPLV